MWPEHSHNHESLQCLFVTAIRNKRYLDFHLAIVLSIRMPLCYLKDQEPNLRASNSNPSQAQDLTALSTKKTYKQLGKHVETVDLRHHRQQPSLTGSRQFVVQMRRPEAAANHKHLFSQLIDHTAKPTLRQAPNRDRFPGPMCPASTRQPSPARNENSRDFCQVSAANFLRSQAGCYAEALSAAALSPR